MLSDDDLLVCPISLQLMVDPVIAADGHTYERANIEKWLSLKSTSPMTNLPLNPKVLIPNLALKKLATQRKQITQTLQKYITRIKELEKQSNMLERDIKTLKATLGQKERKRKEIDQEKKEIQTLISNCANSKLLHLEKEMEKQKELLRNWGSKRKREKPTKNQLQIFVKYQFYGGLCKIHLVDPDDSVQTFKNSLLDSIPLNSVFWFNGKIVDEQKTFRQNNLKNDATICLSICSSLNLDLV